MTKPTTCLPSCCNKLFSSLGKRLSNLISISWFLKKNQEIIKFIDTIVAECGKEKHDYEHHIVDPEMYDDMVAFITPEAMEEAVFTDDKQTREANIRAIEEKLEERYAENEEWLAQIGEAVYAFQKKTVRKMILKDHKRPDGRDIKQIRPLLGLVSPTE